MLTQKVNRQLNNTNGVQVSYGVIEGGSGKSAGRIEVAQGIVALSTPLKCEMEVSEKLLEVPQ